MTAILIFIHTIICVLLVVAILMQSGKGGGLTEGFASAESMLGAQTNTFMTKLTGVLAALFVVTSLTLAFLSSKKDASLMEKANYSEPKTETSAPSDNDEPLDLMVDQQEVEAGAQEDLVFDNEGVEEMVGEVVQEVESVTETVKETVTETINETIEKTTIEVQEVEEALSETQQ